MKLKKLSPDDRMRNFGLTFKEMSQMKQVVALFGRNGSGKSRLLGCLPAHLSRLASDANAINRRLSNLAKTEDSHKIPDHESLWTLQKEMQEKIDPSGGFLTLEIPQPFCPIQELLMKNTVIC
ncbi:MAG: hypothetical protein IPP17_21495 [Bacteroidetes bacterium]|nr:hypothetical protein [Bacteroidota bacterium]